MFFENESLSFNLLDVLELTQENIHMVNKGRNFNALSFRYSADTVLRTDTKEYYMGDNFVSYVPARLDYSRISKKDSMIVVHFETTNYSTKNIEYFESKDPDVLAKLFIEILDCWNRKEIGYKFRCSAILYEIFAECYLQNYKPSSDDEGAGSDQISKSRAKIHSSVEYINRNYKDSSLTIREAAERSFMSEVYFRKLFKEAYGLSPRKYVIKLRIQHAAGLISTGYYSLKQVAYMSGYTDYKYFSVEFKKALGISPSEYLYNYR